MLSLLTALSNEIADALCGAESSALERAAAVADEHAAKIAQYEAVTREGAMALVGVDITARSIAAAIRALKPVSGPQEPPLPPVAR
jgi:hypothetical protein